MLKYIRIHKTDATFRTAQAFGADINEEHIQALYDTAQALPEELKKPSEAVKKSSDDFIRSLEVRQKKEAKKVD